MGGGGWGAFCVFFCFVCVLRPSFPSFPPSLLLLLDFPGVVLYVIGSHDNTLHCICHACRPQGLRRPGRRPGRRGCERIRPARAGAAAEERGAQGEKRGRSGVVYLCV